MPKSGNKEGRRMRVSWWCFVDVDVDVDVENMLEGMPDRVSWW